ncbi:MAG: glycosyltransferase family protein [Akkermansiaceae bacterium]
MKTTVTAIMQARLGSSRLPGKVLLKVGETTFLEHAFSRLSKSTTVDHAVIATTEEAQDDKIARFCEAQNWAYTRGSEQDVLDRYYQTALQFPADIIVRVTSDCPLLDPDLIDEVVECLAQDFPRTHYASNVLPTRSFPRGLDVEAFTFSALETAWKEAKETTQREHVTPFLYQNPERFQNASISFPEDHSDHRWTLDTPEDRDVLSQILTLQPNPVPWKDILKLAEKHPEWLAHNQHIEQKDL